FRAGSGVEPIGIRLAHTLLDVRVHLLFGGVPAVAERLTEHFGGLRVLPPCWGSCCCRSLVQHHAVDHAQCRPIHQTGRNRCSDCVPTRGMPHQYWPVQAECLVNSAEITPILFGGARSKHALPVPAQIHRHRMAVLTPSKWTRVVDYTADASVAR